MRWVASTRSPCVTLLFALFIGFFCGCRDYREELRLATSQEPGLRLRLNDNQLEGVTVMSPAAVQMLKDVSYAYGPISNLTIAEIEINDATIGILNELDLFRLFVHECSFSTEVASKLAELKVAGVFKFIQCDIDDSHIAAMHDIDSPYSFGVGGSKRVTGIGFRSWPEKTNTRDLSLYGSGITDEGSEALSCFTQLEKLDLTETSITSKGLFGLLRFPLLLGPGVPQDITPDMKSRKVLLKEYNRRYRELYEVDGKLPYRGLPYAILD